MNPIVEHQLTILHIILDAGRKAALDNRCVMAEKSCLDCPAKDWVTCEEKPEDD